VPLLTGPDELGCIHQDTVSRHAGRKSVLLGGSGPDATAPPGSAYTELRSLYGAIGRGHLSAGGRALQMVNWTRPTSIVAGAVTRRHCPGERPGNARLRFRQLPRSPRVITAVSRGQHPPGPLRRRRGNMYTILADSSSRRDPEECLKREIFEEVGVR